MDLRDHLNLINNHGYRGNIAIYTGPNLLSTSSGAVVLVQEERIPGNLWDTSEADRRWLKNHRTIERPMTADQIVEQKSKGSGLITFGTCVGVPIKHLEFIYT